MEIYSNEDYRKAHVEVLEILKYISKEDLKKIPNEYIQYCIEDKDSNYRFEYDVNKEFEEQNIMKLTKILISNLYIKYWATDERKKEIKNIFQQEIEKEELENAQLYSYDNLFKKKSKEHLEEVEEKSLIPVKKSFFIRVIDKIKKLLKLT